MTFIEIIENKLYVNIKYIESIFVKDSEYFISLYNSRQYKISEETYDNIISYIKFL